MHELSVCQNMLQQIEDIARQHNAIAVTSVRVQIGPLSGVDAELLSHAFPIAVAGTVAEHATLVVETLPIRICCEQCNTESTASANRLICGNCGDWHTHLVSGDELLLASLELDK